MRERVGGRWSAQALARRGLDALAARAYALGYDAVVGGDRPWQMLLDEVATYTARSGPPPLRVLDVSCGVGTMARRLAKDGHDVVGVDSVARLVETAQRRGSQGPGRCRFYHLDIARESPPDAGGFDVVVSVHTVYWHPDPAAVAAACRRALCPSGHAVVLAYSRRAPVLETFRTLAVREGAGAAIRALRWLVPTAVFEWLRDFQPRYFSAAMLEALLTEAGFEVLEMRETFLARLSLLAWVRRDGRPG